MEKLIELVRENPVLYDTSHEDYMRTKLKNELWETIARDLNYTSGKDAKEQWRKLRECHREAIRRQQKKNGQQTTTTKPWTYQKQMDFLKPYMKNRLTAGCPSTSAPDDSQVEEEDVLSADPPSVQSNFETDQSMDTPTSKKAKKSGDPLLRKYIEDGEKRAKSREELRQKLIAQSQQEAVLQNDALHLFFMSMYNVTKNLPTKFQRQVRRKVFDVVSQAEDDAEQEIESENSFINLQY
ncbi:unnamed protein product [Acanthoscelides obtectus]|uniref:MADF domain-containing protein n=1 Tax=Acanthoscelides obtectus TaxID=200917 RepID=A0A9P0K4Y7_ACAOB|nr:unnamed protein product [Acanthoscelides obtectus]CAK1668840.1 hypothetical protein AOBTE_LOCUS26633 [Acanthoscelides obtectus]